MARWSTTDDDVEDICWSPENSGELIIDVNDLLASPTYVAGGRTSADRPRRKSAPRE